MTNLSHINTLIAHGAEIGFDCGGGEGRIRLTEDFINTQLDWVCSQPIVKAITYDLYLPGIEEALALTIWEDGHIDSGSKETMMRILDR